jgi:hypothetical protein
MEANGNLKEEFVRDSIFIRTLCASFPLTEELDRQVSQS